MAYTLGIPKVGEVVVFRERRWRVMSNDEARLWAKTWIAPSSSIVKDKRMLPLCSLDGREEKAHVWCTQVSRLPSTLLMEAAADEQQSV
jgi:hypothetical protein